MAKDQVNKTKLVVIGGSSGSLEVVIKLLQLLKPGFSVPILLVMHRNPSADSELTELLSTRTFLKVKEVEDKDEIEKGFIYIAPADYHVMVEAEGIFSLDASEKVHYCRPSIDMSYMSAGVSCGAGAAVILLSGANNDGAAGIRSIKETGGYSIVQDPAEAGVAYMPEQAIATGAVDSVMTISEMAAWLNSLS